MLFFGAWKAHAQTCTPNPAECPNYFWECATWSAQRCGSWNYGIFLLGCPDPNATSIVTIYDICAWCPPDNEVGACPYFKSTIITDCYGSAVYNYVYQCCKLAECPAE
jgi:hypothetical protein